MSTTSFVSFSFEARDNETVGDLTQLADDIARLCSYVVGQHTGIPVISFFDSDHRVVIRKLRNPIVSKFRQRSFLRVMHSDKGLPQLFRQCFEKHQRLERDDLWHRLPAFFAGIEDPPFLEQKIASLMAAVEYFIRSSLIESQNFTSKEAETKTLPTLIQEARDKLRWDIPDHYLLGDRYRRLRNTVSHGNALPEDKERVRSDFDKWKLFLLRRLLLKLGFDGEIVSPEKGWSSSSIVHDFSERFNSFEL